MFPRIGKILFLILCSALGFQAHGQDFLIKPASALGAHGLLQLLISDRKYFRADTDEVLQTAAERTVSEFTGGIQITPEAFRCELDVAGRKFPLMSDENRVAMRRVGLDKQILLVRLDTATVHEIYPGALVHHTESLPPNTVESVVKLQKETKLKLHFEADENIEGQRCKKYRLVVKSPNIAEDGIVWMRPDKKGLPVKLQYGTNDRRITMTFRNISTEAPPPELFTVPTNSVPKKNRKEMISAANEAWLQKEIDKVKARESQ